VSDQDFFFDEEEQPAKPASAPKGQAKRPSASAAPRPRSGKGASASVGGSFFEQNVSMTVASLMTVVGLLVGVIIGFVLAPDNAQTASPAASQTAPTLTEEQLQSGQLPPGHPDISGMTPTGSVPATGTGN
jgi:uncharacterized protein YneF (UPF0154 family)